MSLAPTLRIHTDGASRGNPGAAAFGYIISREGVPPIEECGCLGPMTNNQAEYMGLVRALEHALELGAHHHLLVHSDSELLVKQMNREFRVKNGELRTLFQQADALRNQFTGRVVIQHVPRSENSRADQLANEALDGKRPERARQAKAKKAAPTLREHALSCLTGAAAAWRQGADSPSVEKVWDELLALLEKHGAKLPSGSR